MIGGGLAISLDQDWDSSGILSIPGLEWLKDLETVTFGVDGDRDGGSILGRSLVGVTAWVVASSGETLASWWGKLEVLAVLILQGVGQGVEVEGSGNAESDNQIGGSDKSVGGRVGVISSSEVTVVRRDNGVGLVLLDILTIPLTNARATSVGEDNTAELLEGLQLTITLDGGTDLLRTGGDGEEGLGLDTVVQGIPGNGGSTGHILI